MKDKESKLTLIYQNEDDRAYGLAGMSIGLAAMNAIDRVANVTLDTDGPMVSFSNDYYFAAGPSVSPKASWKNLVNNFHVTSAMVVSNLMARSLVRMKHEVPLELLDQVRRAIIEEGEESCALEQDEIDEMFNRILGYAHRIFYNPRLHPAIGEFARMLSRRRTMSGMEILDELRNLQLL